MKRRNLLALLLCGCLLTGLAACGSKNADSAQPEAQGSGALSAALTEDDDKILIQGEIETTDEGAITEKHAKELANEYFMELVDSTSGGNKYAYTLLDHTEVNGRSYYIFRAHWPEHPQDAEAHKKTLAVLFVAEDGSAVYTGTADEDGYTIDR